MYTIITALKSLYRNKFVNLTVIVSLALGMLFPMLVFCIGNVQLKTAWGTIPYHTERLLGLVGDPGTEHRIDCSKAKLEHPEIEHLSEGSFVIDNTAIFKNKFYTTETAGYKGNQNKIIRYNMIYGEFFTDEELNGNEKICAITISLQEQLGCMPGDYITLGKTEEKLLIKGVYGDYKCSVIMPLETFIEIYSSSSTDLAYTFQFKEGIDLETEGKEILSSLTEEYEIENKNFINIEENDSLQINLRNAYFALSIMLAIASVVLIYAALNIFNILINKLNNDMKNYMVKMQVGASKGKIYGFVAVQLFVLMLISVAADVGIVLFLKKYISHIVIFPFILDLSSILITAALGSLYVLILAFAMVKRLRGRRLVTQ